MPVMPTVVWNTHWPLSVVLKDTFPPDLTPSYQKRSGSGLKETSLPNQDSTERPFFCFFLFPNSLKHLINLPLPHPSRIKTRNLQMGLNGTATADLYDVCSIVSAVAHISQVQRMSPEKGEFQNGKNKHLPPGDSM